MATTGTLELLTKARSLSSKVTAFVGGDASAIAAALGDVDVSVPGAVVSALVVYALLER